MENDMCLIKNESAYFLKKVSVKKEISDNEIFDGYLIDCQGNENEVRRITESLRRKNKIIAVVGYDNHFNRRVLETMSINYLVSPEKYPKYDTLKQRDSGINHVLAKIAKQKNISIVIDFSDIKKLEPFSQSIRISRISQNIKVCRKTKTKINIATFATNKKEINSSKELQEFMLSIGSSTIQSKESTKY